MAPIQERSRWRCMIESQVCSPACVFGFAWRCRVEPRRFAPECFGKYCLFVWCFGRRVTFCRLLVAASRCGSLWSYKRHKAILQMLHVFVCNNWSVLMYDAHALAHRKRVVCVWVSSQVYGVSMFIDAHLYSCRPRISVCQRVTHHIIKLRRKC